jgi:hypothetical protein
MESLAASFASALESLAASLAVDALASGFDGLAVSSPPQAARANNTAKSAEMETRGSGMTGGSSKQEFFSI